MLERLRPLERARFDPVKMAKVNLTSGKQMMVGLNCFQAGQEHALHSHAGQDKLYHVLAGRGLFTVGDAVGELEAGDLVLAPGGVAHAVANRGVEPLVVLVVMAPPPGAAS